MTTLVTGAAGFLGGHVIDLLVAQGERPRALIAPSDDPRRLAAAELDVRSADLADRAALQKALEGAECVIHCAARTGPWGAMREYVRTNIYGLDLLIREALATGVQRIVHVSSVTVHGNDVGGVADETTPLREERNPYSRSKVAGERLVQRHVSELGAPVTIVRPGWIYGPRDAASFARIAAMIANGRMFVIGSGDNHLPLVHVRDAARGLILAAEAPPAVTGRAYVLVNDEPVTQEQFLTTVAAALGVPSPNRHVPYRVILGVGALSEDLGRLLRIRRPPPVTRYGLQLLGGDNRFVISRARRELGFRPQVSLQEGVRQSVRWYRDDEVSAALEAAA